MLISEMRNVELLMIRNAIIQSRLIMPIAKTAAYMIIFKLQNSIEISTEEKSSLQELITFLFKDLKQEENNDSTYDCSIQQGNDYKQYMLR